MFHIRKGQPILYTDYISHCYSEHKLDNAVIDTLGNDMWSVENRLSNGDRQESHSIIVRISVSEPRQWLGSILLQMMMMRDSLALGDKVLALYDTQYTPFHHPYFDYMIHSVNEEKSTLRNFYKQLGFESYDETYHSPISINREALTKWSQSGSIPVKYWKVINTEASLTVALSDEEIDELFDMWDNQ